MQCGNTVSKFGNSNKETVCGTACSIGASEIYSCQIITPMQHKKSESSYHKTHVGIKNMILVLTDSLHYARTCATYLSFSRNFSVPCASFSMLDGPGGTDCNVPEHRKASAKNSSKLNKFLHSEVNQLIQLIFVFKGKVSSQSGQ